MLKALSTVAVMLLATGTLQAQLAVTPSPFTGKSGSLVIDQTVRHTLAGAREARIEGFRLGDREVALELTRFDVLAPDAIVVHGTDAGDVAVARPDVQAWRGTVMGEPDTRVYMALTADAVNGYVIDRDDTWIMSSGPVGSPVIIESFDRLLTRGVKLRSEPCAGALSIPGAPPPVMNFTDGPGPRSYTCRTIRVAVDCDYELTQDRFAGNATAAAAYVTSLFGAISEIYQRDTNIVIEVSYLRTWTTSNDPYTASGAGDQLYQFREYWNANMGGVSRDLAHMISGRGLGGGVAWLSVACHPSYHYALSANMNGFFPYPLQNHSAQNWDVMVVAHETGHNLGTHHTHEPSQYNPPIDGCGNAYLNPPQPQDCSDAWNGTIMSYCHICPGGMTNINLTFPTRVADTIRAYMDGAAAACGTVPTLEITQQPQIAIVPAGANAVFTVGASGPAPITYQWRRNEVALTNSAHILGAQTSQLTIVNVQAADAGEYDVVVNNVCGEVTSESASLVIQSSCYANCDGSTATPLITANDFQCFLNAFAAALPYANCDGSTGTPALTANDFQCFINAAASGCP